MTNWLNRLVSHRLRALVQKELNQIKRDRRIMMSLILPPILQLMLFGSVMNPSVANINLGIVDDSQSPASRDLVAALSESGSFTLRGSINRPRSSAATSASSDDRCRRRHPVGLRPRPRSGPLDDDSGAAERDEREHGGDQPGLRAGRGPELQRALGRARCGRRSVQVHGAGRRRGVALLHPTLLYNPGGVSTWFIVTGLLGTLLIMNGTITASTTMVKEREAGTLEQLLMTPAGMTEIIVAKIVPPFVLLGHHGDRRDGRHSLLFQRAVQRQRADHRGVVGAVPAVRHRDRHGRRDDHQVGAAGAAGDVLHHPPLMSLSGAMSPAEAMPAWMRPWTALNPVYHFGVISRASLIKGSGFVDLWPHVLALLGVRRWCSCR